MEKKEARVCKIDIIDDHAYLEQYEAQADKVREKHIVFKIPLSPAELSDREKERQARGEEHEGGRKEFNTQYVHMVTA